MTDETPKEPRRQRKVSPRLLLRVTQDLIDTALPKDSGHCMVADAIKVAFPTAKSVSVDLQAVRFSDPAKGLRYVYLTPRIAQTSLIEFDEGIVPHPFQCELARAVQIVSMTLRPGKRGERAKATMIHPLGRKHIQPEGTHGVPTVIGGKTPPIMRERPTADTVSAAADEKKVSKPTPRSHRKKMRREFGLRSFKTGHDILISGQA